MSKPKKSKIDQSTRKKPNAVGGVDVLNTYGPPTDPAQKSIILELINAISRDDVVQVDASIRQLDTTGVDVFQFEFANFPVSINTPPLNILYWAFRARAYRSTLELVSMALETAALGYSSFFLETQHSLEVIPKNTEGHICVTNVVRLFAAKCAARFESEAIYFCTGHPQSVEIFKEEIAKLLAAKEVNAIARHIAPGAVSTDSMALKFSGAKRL